MPEPVPPAIEWHSTKPFERKAAPRVSGRPGHEEHGRRRRWDAARAVCAPPDCRCRRPPDQSSPSAPRGRFAPGESLGTRQPCAWAGRPSGEPYALARTHRLPNCCPPRRPQGRRRRSRDCIGCGSPSSGCCESRAAPSPSAKRAGCSARRRPAAARGVRQAREPRLHAALAHLVKKHVLSVGSVTRELLQHPVLADAVLSAELLPKLHADCQQRRVVKCIRARGGTPALHALWLPHWPTWRVMISRGIDDEIQNQHNLTRLPYTPT